MSLDSTIDRLSQLVACDTQNPPRNIHQGSDIFGICSDALSDGFEISVTDHGEGHVTWFAVRGNPHVLFNVHLDTVPAGEGWSHDPHELVIKDGRAYGRGACDIKGAAAVLLTIAKRTSDDMALLFTTDEEGAGGCCVQKFIDSGGAERFSQVIVAEPTGCRAVTGHRGFLSVKTRFHGLAGHSSEARALNENANHQMACWAASALALVGRKKTSPEDPATCMNLGLVDGGTKSNVIAAHAFVHWSARLQPGECNQTFLEEIKACAPEYSNAEWEVPFAGEPLPAAGQSSKGAEEFCRQHGLSIAEPVNFWTEAALFSAAGIPAIVLGPGHITEAHQTDEWVELDQLEQALEIYTRLVSANE